MNMIDALLGPTLTENVTETTWWADTIFHGLEQDPANEQDRDGTASAASGLNAEPT